MREPSTVPSVEEIVAARRKAIDMYYDLSRVNMEFWMAVGEYKATHPNDWHETLLHAFQGDAAKYADYGTRPDFPEDDDRRLMHDMVASWMEEYFGSPRVRVFLTPRQLHNRAVLAGLVDGGNQAVFSHWLKSILIDGDRLQPARYQGFSGFTWCAAGCEYHQVRFVDAPPPGTRRRANYDKALRRGVLR